MESTHGVLFRLGARAGLLAFAGVMLLTTWQGMDPTLAFLRGLVALLVLTACGWVAERIGAAATSTGAAAAKVEETDEPETDEEDSAEPESKPAAA